MSKSIYGLALIMSAGFFMSPAHADEEVLLTRPVVFDDCPKVIKDTIRSLDADFDHVSVETDTGAHYRVKLASYEANLEFRCNAVSEKIVILRTTPGDLVAVAAQ